MREANFSPPVFAVSGCEKVTRPEPGSKLDPNQLVLFGANADICAASGFFAPKDSLPERKFHQAYCEKAPKNAKANKPWKDLPEEFRVSNRRAVAHIPAKLFDAGFDLRAWMAKNDILKTLPLLAPGQPLYRSDTERERLAELEHERWIADRRISGWRYAGDRNDDRKHHPDIKPYADLTDEKKGYDLDSIDQLQNFLTDKAGTLTRLPSVG